jgi:hypothetical protein
MRTEIGHLNVDHFLSITTDTSKPTTKNKIAEKWKRKIANRTGILDTGCTSGAGAEMDMDLFHNTGHPSKKVFMLPDKTKKNGNKNDALKAQSPGGGRRDEHSAKSALFTDKCAKDGRAWVHCSIRQKGG